jgi:hypothetical protein
VGLPTISVQGNEPPIYLDHGGIVSSVLLTLATAATRNPEWVLGMLRDLDAVAVVEARGMSVTDRGSEDIIRAIYEVIGTPVVEMNAGQALQYAKRLEDAADSVSTEIDRSLRHQFKLREAQKLLTESAEPLKFDAASIAERQAVASGQMPGAAMVMRLGTSKPAFGQESPEVAAKNNRAQDAYDSLYNGTPPHERTENNQIPSAQDVADALVNGEERN